MGLRYLECPSDPAPVPRDPCGCDNGGCAYTGRTMKDGHKDLGLQNADMGALVEDLQAAMEQFTSIAAATARCDLKSCG